MGIMQTNLENTLIKKKMINVLIINAHWNNRGDEAQIRSLIDGLRQKLPIQSIEIMILSKKVTEFPYKDIRIIAVFPIVSNSISIIKLGINFIVSLLSFGKFGIGSQAKKYAEAVMKADVIIHAPGGPSIGEIYSGGFGIDEFLFLYRLLIPILQGKLVFFYAPSMGPFTSKLKNLLRKFVLKKASPIVVREGLSRDHLERQLGLKAYTTLDAAFQNCIPVNYNKKYDNLAGFDEIVKIIEKKNVVGVVVTDLAWHPKYAGDSILRNKIIQSISDTLDYLISRGYKLLLIPHLFGEQNDEKLLKNFVTRETDIFILPQQIDAYGQQVLIAKLFAVISMRYHPALFAAKGNVPTICIYYEHKMKGFIEILGRIDLLINVENISYDLIIEKFQYLEKNIEQIKNEIQQKVPELREASKMTLEILKKQLSKHETIKLLPYED
jgi:colanic acid/amylovoran biosynthesis protein